MDAGFGADEGNGTAVVAGDEVIDVVPELVDIGEAGAGEGAALEDGEPDLDLVEPGAVGRGEIEADVWVAGEPAFALGLVGRKIVEDDVDLLTWIGGRRRLIEQRQNPLVAVASVTRGRPGSRQIAQPTQALAPKAPAPSA